MPRNSLILSPRSAKPISVVCCGSSALVDKLSSCSFASLSYQSIKSMTKMVASRLCRQAYKCVRLHRSINSVGFVSKGCSKITTQSYGLYIGAIPFQHDDATQSTCLARPLTLIRSFRAFFLFSYLRTNLYQLHQQPLLPFFASGNKFYKPILVYAISALLALAVPNGNSASWLPNNYLSCLISKK